MTGHRIPAVMRLRPLQRAGARGLFVALVISSSLTSCTGDSHHGSAETTVSGTCALYKEKYELSPISTRGLERTFAPGRYTVSGNVSSDDRPDADAQTSTSTRRWGPPGVPIDGSCDYADAAGTRRLSVAVGQKDLPRNGYDDARRTQQSDPRAKEIDGADGYVISENVADADGSNAEQAVAVVFEDGKRYVTANILAPKKGVNSGAEAVAIAKEAALAFRMPMGTSTQGPSS